MMNKKLIRSQYNRRIGGVCGGLGEYTNSDPTIWRLIFAICIFTPIPIILFYLLAWIILPEY
jgi:phage shock protein C